MPRSGQRIEHLEADVCVVGAGFAGLAAARRLTRSGLSAVVLYRNPSRTHCARVLSRAQLAAILRP